jgi:hypothetical protein
MAYPEHRARLVAGIHSWNDWRHEHPEIKIDLSETDLSKADLHQANLSGANLFGTDLIGADLCNSDLSWSDLRQADLSLAFLQGASLHGAVLDLATLDGANLRRTEFREAKLIGTVLGNADLSEARFGMTVLDNIDFSSVIGLEQTRHYGSSAFGIATLYRSKGIIPEIFLRGCGVPEEFITFAKALVTNPIEYYSCFISYSTKDQSFADRLYVDLQNKGVRCWFAPHDVQGGKKLHEQIDEAIRLHDKLLLILSPHSMASEWVKAEIAKARKREIRDYRRVLFPIRLVSFETLRDWECFDADTGKDSAREIREYFIPDFSNWKNHDSYEEAFTALIRDLKALSAKTAAAMPINSK